MDETNKLDELEKELKSMIDKVQVDFKWSGLYEEDRITLAKAAAALCREKMKLYREEGIREAIKLAREGAIVGIYDPGDQPIKAGISYKLSEQEIIDKLKA